MISVCSDLDQGAFTTQVTGTYLLVSTSESMPYIGCIYNIGRRSIESLPYRMPSKPAPSYSICVEPLSQVALMKMPCNCLRCLDCLAESFKLALSARHNFPPKVLR
jgi:hypothetical protein